MKSGLHWHEIEAARKENKVSFRAAFCFVGIGMLFRGQSGAVRLRLTSSM